MEDLKDKLLIAWLKEDEYGVASFLDLLISIFRSLDGAGLLDEKTQQQVQSLYDLDPDEAQQVAAETLKTFVGDRTLLVLMENLDEIFKGLGDQGQQTAASQLKILKETGYVKSELQGRESWYELREPLMRLSVEVKKNRGEPIRLFVDFLRLWYSKDELEERLNALGPDAHLEREYVCFAMKLVNENPDPRVTACLRDLQTFEENKDWERVFAVTEELLAIEQNALHLGLHGYALSHLNRHEEAQESNKKALALDSEDFCAQLCAGVGLSRLGRHDKALERFRTATELQPDLPYVWMFIAGFLTKFGRYKESTDCLERVIKLDHAELQIPARLLNAAVEYITTKDERALLKLPEEQRDVLMPLLGLGEQN